MEWKYENGAKRRERKNRIFQDKTEAMRKWHRWFAWYPVSVDGEIRIWLQRIYRKADIGISQKNGYNYIASIDWLYRKDCYEFLKENFEGNEMGGVASNQQSWPRP